MYKALDYVFKGLHGMLKNIHVRVEMKGKSGDLYSAIGLVIPYAKFSPSLGARPDGVAKIDPLVVLSVKSIQVYADYDRPSYCSKGSSDASIAKHFVERWSVEVHTSVILPFDLDINFAVGIRRRIGLLSPKVSCKTPLLRVVCDFRQLEVLRDFVALVAFSTKRGQQLVRVQKIFRKGFPLPRMYEVGVVRLLPHLLIRGKVYPMETNLPVSDKSGSIAAFMKERVGERWAAMLWKHLIRLVLHDLRVTRPSGRWFELGRLAFIRREYAFMYSKLLKRSKETGHFILDVNTKMSADKLRQLFEYEMYLPVKAVLMFRVLATMIATAELFNSKRKQAQQVGGAKGGSAQAFEKMSIKYKDVLRIFVELFEVSRETASHKFDRHNLDDDGDIDDSASNRASEEGSVYAHSIHSRASINQFADTSSTFSAEQSSHRSSPANVVRGASKPASTPTASTGSSLTSMFSRSHVSSSNVSFQSPSATTSASSAINNSLRSSAKTVASLQSSAMKMFGGGGGAGGGQVDEYDHKLMGKFDLSVFGSMFTMEAEDRVRNDQSSHTPTDQPVNDSLREVFDWQLKGQTPPLSLIAESVQWVLQRHQETLTLMPPDITLAADKITVDVRTPLALPHSDRRNLLSTTISGVSFNATISQSSQNTPGGPDSQTDDDNARKLSSLAGSLIQLRLVAKHVLSVLHLENTGNDDELTAAPAVDASNGKGSLLSAGLPAYPISQQSASQRDGESDDGGSAQEDEEAERDDDASQVSSRPSEQEQDDEDPYGNGEVTPVKEMRFMNAVSNKAAPISTTALKTLPGETVMEAMRRQQAEQRSMENSDAFKTPVNKRPPPPTPLTIPASSNKSAPVVEAVNQNPLERELLRSVRSENALVMCLILDFDDKGEGAADVQMQLGGMGLDLSKTVLSALIVPRIATTLSNLVSAWSETRQYLPLLSERTLIIDREQKMSAVALAIDAPTRPNPSHKRLDEADPEPVEKGGVPSVAVTFEGEEEEEEEDSVNIEEMYRKQLEEESHGEEENEDEEEEEGSSSGDGSDVENNVHDEPQQQAQQTRPAVVAQSAAEKARITKLLIAAHAQDAAHRRAMVENKNIQQWIGITESHMPRVLSICVRTSVVTVNMLEATVLRDLVYSKIHNVIDLAAQRDRNASSPLAFATDHILGLLGNILLGGNAAFNPYRGVRKWGSKRYPQINKNTPASQSNVNLKAVLTIPSTELVIAKASVPYPCLELHVQGFEMKVPMSDETMCHLSAITLAELMPFYC
eukprot:gene21775-27839_t